MPQSVRVCAIWGVKSQFGNAQIYTIFLDGASLRLNSHVLIVHTGLQKFKCKQCDFNSGYSDSLKSHIGRYHQNVRTGRTMCSWQGVQISQHMRSAHLLKKSKGKKCDICDMEYVNDRNLRLHKERAHFVVRYSCPKCEYKATTTGNLKVRIKSKHEDVKSLCTLCDYRAYQKPSLSKHVKAVHSIIRPFSCNNCDFKTAKKTDLKKALKKTKLCCLTVNF